MKVDVLGIYIDNLTLAETAQCIGEAVKEKKPCRVVTANPEMIYAANQDKGLRDLINSANLVTADGIGVIWAAACLGTPLQERVTGIDLLQALFPLAGERNWRIFFLGGRPGVAERAAAYVQQDFPGIIWQAENGFFSFKYEIELQEKIRLFNPDLLLVGLGAPRQDYWIAANSELASVTIGVGGSFDALAGIVIRAPQWIRNLNLEWLYRLWQEPWRWKRQMVLPRFVLRVMKEKFIIHN
ncbi:MAG: WecB/TagA/CpsF family glycosyltransferase [Desulfitobacteriaceae bacterium]